jgi:hypothetical protein
MRSFAFFFAALRLLILGAGLVGLLFAALIIIGTGSQGALSIPKGSLAAAGFVYLASHGLRVLRLALLIGGWRIGFRTIAKFHLFTAAVSLIAPLKLGEVFRIAELTNIVGSGSRAIAIVWLERGLDICAILFLLMMTDAHSLGRDFNAIAALAIVFIVATALTFFVVPDNLRRLSVFIIRRYSNPVSVPLLKSIDRLRRSILQAPQLLQKRIGTLAALTALIWACELAAFYFASGTASGNVADCLITILSDVTQGDTLLSSAAHPDASHHMPYLAATHVPLLFVGLLTAGFYIRLISLPQKPPARWYRLRVGVSSKTGLRWWRALKARQKSQSLRPATAS